MSNFLPDNYEAPSSGGHYLKLKGGKTRIRIISKPILGWEAWTDENKPVRGKYTPDEYTRLQNIPNPKINAGQKQNPKHFWAVVVWNFAGESIEILQLTQNSIQNAIKAYSQSPDWGAPYSYDLEIEKSGEGLETEYKVLAMPKSTFNKDSVFALLKESPVMLDKLYTGDDPFNLDDIEKGVAMKDIEELEKSILPF